MTIFRSFSLWVIALFLLNFGLEANVTRIMQAAAVLPDYGELPMNLISLSGGLTNENYRLQIGSQTYFIRSCFENNAMLGSSLESEFSCLSLLSAFEIAPKPIVYDPGAGVLITEFIPVKPGKINFRDFETMHKACTLIKKLHSTDVQFPVEFCPFETIAEYICIARSVDADVPSSIYDIIWPKIEDYRDNSYISPLKVPCHLDLHSENILNDGTRLWIIDWEYAGLADPYFDLATLASVERFNDDEMNKLLAAYSEDLPSGDQVGNLYFMRILADVRWALWCFIQAKVSPIEGSFTEEADRYLQECLIRLSTLD